MRFNLNHLQTRSGYFWIILALYLVGSPGWHTVEAAPAMQPGEPPETMIYVVQAGDTLYGIAQRFGVTVDLLVSANNIDDPTQIAVGQRLTIPPVPEAAEPSLIHTVLPGETLHALSLQYNLATMELALENHLIRPDQLYIGQSLTIRGDAGEPPPLRGRSHSVDAGETLVQVAAQYQFNPWGLTIANNLRSPFAIPAADHLWIPGDDGEFFDWDEPFGGIEVHPIPAVQGQTLSIQITTTVQVSLDGSWMDIPLTFFPHKEREATLVGVDALGETGIYSLIITAPTTRGGLATFSQPLPVVSGEYGTENIVVSDETAAAITPEVVLEESRQLEQLFSARTESALWDGYMGIPAVGDVTSAFGTRRTYNIPNGSAYHTGTDFGTSVGSPVFSPADGVVVFSELLIVRGNVIIIDHGWGVMTGYWHLSASHVNGGEPLVQGQHIGDIGNTGLSTGPHLHWEMRVGGQPVNGMQWVWEQFP